MLHYSIFKFETRTQRFFNSPFNFLLNTKKIKTYYKKRGIDNPIALIEKVTTSEENSISEVLSGIQMGGLLVMIEFGVFNYIQGALNVNLFGVIAKNAYYLIGFIALLLIPAGIFNYYTLFKNDKYLIFFKEFKQMKVQDTKKYAFISLMAVVSIVLFCISSFVFLTR